MSHPEGYSPAEVDIEKLRKAIDNVIIRQYASLTKLPAASLKTFANSLFSSKVISEAVQSEPTFDKILGEFKATLRFTRKVKELEASCNKLLQAMSSVGGSYHLAADALKDDWIEAVKNDCQYSFNISLS